MLKNNYISVVLRKSTIHLPFCSASYLKDAQNTILLISECFF